LIIVVRLSIGRLTGQELGCQTLDFDRALPQWKNAFSTFIIVTVLGTLPFNANLLQIFSVSTIVALP
jgi:hypothetical protein